MDLPKSLVLIAIMAVALVAGAAKNGYPLGTKESAFVGGYVWRYGVQPPSRTIDLALKVWDLKYADKEHKKVIVAQMIDLDYRQGVTNQIGLPEIRRILEVFGWDLDTLASVVLDCFSFKNQDSMHLDGGFKAYFESQNSNIQDRISKSYEKIQSIIAEIQRVQGHFKTGFATMLLDQMNAKDMDPQVFKKLVPFFLGFYYFDASNGNGDTNADLYRLVTELGWDEIATSLGNTLTHREAVIAAYSFTWHPKNNVASAIEVWKTFYPGSSSVADFIISYFLEACSSASERVDALKYLYKDNVTLDIRQNSVYDQTMDSLLAPFYQNDAEKFARRFYVYLARANLMDDLTVVVNFAEQISWFSGLLPLAEVFLTEGSLDRFTSLVEIINRRQNNPYLEETDQLQRLFTLFLNVKSEFMQGNFATASYYIEKALGDIKWEANVAGAVGTQLQSLMASSKALFAMKHVELLQSQPSNLDVFWQDELAKKRASPVGSRLATTLLTLSDSNSKVFEHMQTAVHHAMNNDKGVEQVEEQFQNPQGPVSKFYPAMKTLWDSVKGSISESQAGRQLLEQNKVEISRSQAQIKELGSTNQALSGLLEAGQAELAQLQRSLGESQARASDLNAEVGRLREQYSELSGKHKELEEYSKEAYEINLKLKAALATAQQKVAQQESKQQVLENEKTRLQEAWSEAQSTLANASEQLKEALMARGNLQEEGQKLFNNLYVEKQGLVSDLDQAKSNLIKSKAEVEALQAELVRSKAQLSNTQEQLGKLQKYEAELREIQQQLGVGDAKKIVKRVSDAETKQRKLAGKAQQLEESLSRITAADEKVKEQLKATKAALTRTEQDASNLRAKLQSLLNLLGYSHKDHPDERLQDTMQMAGEKIVRLERESAELEKVRSKLAEEQSNLKEQVEQTKKLSSDLQTQERKLQEASEQQRHLGNELKAKSSKLETAQTAFKASAAENAKWKSALDGYLASNKDGPHALHTFMVWLTNGTKRALEDIQTELDTILVGEKITAPAPLWEKVREHRAQLEKVQLQFEAEKARLAAQTEQVEKLSNLSSSCENALRAAEKEKERLEKELEGGLAKLAETQSALKATAAENEERTRTFSTNLSTHGSQLQEASDKARRLQEELTAGLKKLLETQSALKATVAENVRWKSALDGYLASTDDGPEALRTFMAWVTDGAKHSLESIKTKVDTILMGGKREAPAPIWKRVKEYGAGIEEAARQKERAEQLERNRPSVELAQEIREIQEQLGVESVAQIVGRVSAAEGEQRRLTEKIRELEKQSANTNAALATTKEQLEAKLGTLKTTEERLESTLRNFKATKEQLESKIKALNETKEQLENRIESLNVIKEESFAIKANLESLLNLLGYSKADKTGVELRNAAEGAKKRIAELLDESAELKREKARLSAHVDSAKKLSNELHSHESELQQASQERERLEKELAAKLKKLETAESISKATAAENHRWQSALAGYLAPEDDGPNVLSAFMAWLTNGTKRTLEEIQTELDAILLDGKGEASAPIWRKVEKYGVRMKEAIKDAATAAEKAGSRLSSIQSEIGKTMGRSDRDSVKRIEAVIAQIAPSKGSAPLSLNDFLRDIQQIFNRSTLAQVKEALEELPDKVREQDSLDNIIREYGESMRHGAVAGKSECQLRFASDEGELEAKYRDFEKFFRDNAGKLDIIKERADNEHFHDTELEGIKSEMILIFETLKRLEAQNQILADLRSSEAVLSSETIKEKEAEVGRLHEQNLKYQKSNENVHKLQEELKALRARKGVPHEQFVKLQSSLQKAQEERDAIKADVRRLEDLQKQLDAAHAIRETLEKSRAEMEKNCYCLPPRTSKADHRQDTLILTASLEGPRAAASGREAPESEMEVCRTRIGQWIESFGVWMRDRSFDAPTDPPGFPEKCFQHFAPSHFQKLTPSHAAWLPMEEMTAEQFERMTVNLMPYLSFPNLPRYDGKDPQHPCSVITSDHLSKMHQSSCLMVKEICHQKGILSYACH